MLCQPWNVTLAWRIRAAQSWPVSLGQLVGQSFSVNRSRQRPIWLPPLKVGRRVLSTWEPRRGHCPAFQLQLAPLLWIGHLERPSPVSYGQLSPLHSLINFILILSLPSVTGLTYPTFPWCQNSIISNKGPHSVAR